MGGTQTFNKADRGSYACIYGGKLMVTSSNQATNEYRAICTGQADIYNFIYTPMITIINVCRCTPKLSTTSIIVWPRVLEPPYLLLHLRCCLSSTLQLLSGFNCTNCVPHSKLNQTTYHAFHCTVSTVNPSLDCLALSCHKSDAPQPFYTFICTHHHFHLSLCICIPSTWLKSLYLHSVYFKILV